MLFVVTAFLMYYFSQVLAEPVKLRPLEFLLKAYAVKNQKTLFHVTTVQCKKLILHRLICY